MCTLHYALSCVRIRALQCHVMELNTRTIWMVGFLKFSERWSATSSVLTNTTRSNINIFGYLNLKHKLTEHAIINIIIHLVAAIFPRVRYWRQLDTGRGSFLNFLLPDQSSYESNTYLFAQNIGTDEAFYAVWTADSRPPQPWRNSELRPDCLSTQHSIELQHYLLIITRPAPPNTCINARA